MKSFRNTLAIALTAITIGLGVISTSDTASAFVPGRHFSHHFGHCANLCRRPGHHWTNHFSHRWGHYHQHWSYHFRFHGHYHWHHRWGYRWDGYRHVVHGVTHAVPVVAGVCPPGTHLGYEHKFCWPNRY